MIELEWEKRGTRNDAAELLRSLADSLAAGDDEVEIEHGGWELKLKVPKEVGIGVELEVEDGETELEIELKWSSGGRAAAKKKS